VLQLDIENLSATVAAGLTLGVLQTALREHGLFYPPAFGLPPAATVGEHLTEASCGPWRLGRGTTRDWVLGLSITTGDGQTLRTGSRVVKNVAGLDITKLMIGSRGRLGAIDGAHLRVAPLPGGRAVVAARFAAAADAVGAAPALLASRVNPSALELDGPWLLVGLEGTDADLPRRTAFCASALQEAGGILEQRSALDASPLPGEGVLVKAGVPAYRGRDWVLGLPDGTPVQGQAGNGLFRAMLPPDRALLARLCEAAAAAGGYCYVADGPAELAAAFPAEPAPAVKGLEERIRRVFDPEHRLGREQ
jgi:FAD/FMN-containing dehydrogenase